MIAPALTGVLVAAFVVPAKGGNFNNFTAKAHVNDTETAADDA